MVTDKRVGARNGGAASQAHVSVDGLSRHLIVSPLLPIIRMPAFMQHRRRGKRLSNDLRECIITMNKKLSASQIVALTGIPKTTVFRIIQEFKHNGTVAVQDLEFRGRPRALDYVHTEVCACRKPVLVAVGSRGVVPLRDTKQSQ